MGQRFLFLDDDPERHEHVQTAYPAGTYYAQLRAARYEADRVLYLQIPALLSRTDGDA